MHFGTPEAMTMKAKYPEGWAGLAVEGELHGKPFIGIVEELCPEADGLAFRVEVAGLGTVKVSAAACKPYYGRVPTHG